MPNPSPKPRSRPKVLPPEALTPQDQQHGALRPLDRDELLNQLMLSNPRNQRPVLPTPGYDPFDPAQHDAVPSSPDIGAAWQASDDQVAKTGMDLARQRNGQRRPAPPQGLMDRARALLESLGLSRNPRTGPDVRVNPSMLNRPLQQAPQHYILPNQTHMTGTQGPPAFPGPRQAQRVSPLTQQLQQEETFRRSLDDYEGPRF